MPNQVHKQKENAIYNNRTSYEYVLLVTVSCPFFCPELIAIDEDCDSDPCDPNAECTELPGSGNFICTCIPPFEGDGFTCSE